MSLDSHKFMVFHPAWGYFARDFGLEQIPVEVGGQEPSAQELAHLIAKQMTILMISHDLSAVSSYVKTVGCLNRRLFYHGEDHMTPEMLELAYQCPIDLIAHGVPHRVFAEHGDEREAQEVRP